MKKLLLSFILSFFIMGVEAQVIKDTLRYNGKMEWRCGVAHITKDGVFGCDFKGTYYPSHIYDSSVRKWFIKIVNGDSLFYYRTDVEDLYIWNGRKKDQQYGYEWKQGCGSITIPDKHNGSDTLRRIRQEWSPKN